MSRQTIGESPLDMIISTPDEDPKAKHKVKRTVNENGSNKPSNKKQRLTVQISEDVIERAKNAVYWTRGLTLAQLTEEALEKGLSNLENNNVIYDDKTGKPLKGKGDKFPCRKEELKSGRPVN